MVGAGKAEGGMDVGNMLKPALPRGELQLLGATTLDEYRILEKDAALARRFQSVYVKEPNLEDTLSIHRGLKPHYELHHLLLHSSLGIVLSLSPPSGVFTPTSDIVLVLDEACIDF
jgi:ATP-dependent Clp protease ATP-binding subunit ClpA